MKHTIPHNLFIVFIVLIFASSCEDTTEPPLKIPQEWEETSIPLDDWMVMLNKGDRLALISDQAYIEIDEEENILKNISLPKYTRMDPKPLITEDYFVFGYERQDTSLQFGSEFVIEIRSVEKDLAPAQIRYKELLPSVTAIVDFYGPVAAINNQNQVLLNFKIAGEDTRQFYLFNILEKNDSLTLELLKEFPLDGDDDIEESPRIKAFGANFFIESHVLGRKALVYRMDPFGNQKVAFLGEVSGYFQLRDTLFASTAGASFLNGQRIKYSVDDGLNWDDYQAYALDPFIPKLVVQDTLIFKSYYYQELFHSEDLKSGTEISSLGLPTKDLSLIDYFQGNYYIFSFGKFYKRSSIIDDI